jgi:hypothetical protein
MWPDYRYVVESEKQGTRGRVYFDCVHHATEQAARNDFAKRLYALWRNRQPNTGAYMAYRPNGEILREVWIKQPRRAK